MLPAIPTGTYYLRVEPEAERNTGVIQYSVKVMHGVAISSWFLIAAGLLLVPAILLSWRSISFEHMRWQESDSNTATAAATALSSLISRHEDDDDDS